MKVILLPVADRPECRLALEQSFALARATGGNVVGCHLRPDEDNEPDSGKAEALFTQTAEEQSFDLIRTPALGVIRTARWIEMAGSLDRLFAIVGPLADVSVVSRPKKSSSGPAADFMLAALLGTGRPVIVLPQAESLSLGRRILIAWNQSAQAARAVAAAIPLLKLAESVHIVSAGDESPEGPNSAAVVDYLKYWGIRATKNRTSGRDPAADIFDEYRKEDADLIVMGAYSRSRMRQTIFGGVTQDLLFRASPPVFALHS